MAVRLLVTAVLYAACALAQAQPVSIAAGNQLISFELPDAAFGSDGAQLSVDLDGYDVTAFGRIEGTVLHLDLDVALVKGEHALSVFLFHADGSAEVIVESVFAAPVIESREWAFNTLFETNYRADENPSADYDGVASVANSGSVSLSGSAVSGGWSSGIAADAMYNQANEAVPGGHAWLLPSYQAYTGYSTATAEAWAMAGNIAVARDNLLFSAYQRRGAALEAAAATGRFRMQAFTVSSGPRNAFDGDYVVPSDSSEETNGFATSFVVSKQLEIGGGFIDGKSALGGAGFNQLNDPLIYGGDSWNLSLDSRWLEDSVWIHFEHAESDFDADGIGEGFAASADDATQAMVQLSSAGALGAGPFEYWSAVLRYNKVGREFYSLGNLSLPGNLEVSSAWFQGGFSSVVVDLEFARETTNPDDNPLRATQTLERAGLNLSWSPVTIDVEAGPWKLLGVPSLSGWLYSSDNSQPDSDSLLAGFDLDSQTDDAGISVMFARDSVNWSIEYGVVDYDDRSSTVIDNGFIIYEPFSDSRNRHLSLLASWAPTERLSLDAYLQRNTLEETDFANEYRSTNYGLSGNVVLVPDKLSLFASVSQGNDRNRYGDQLFAPEHFKSRFASLQLNWLAREAQGAKPAINVFMKGNYGRNEDLGFLFKEDFWAVYVGASLNWLGDKR